MTGKYAIALYVALVLAIVAGGIAMLLKFGYEPTPVSIMSPSTFDRPDQIGQALVRRFYSPIAQDKVVVFGIPPQPDWQREIVRGFMIAAAHENVPFEVLLAEEQMPPLDVHDFPGIEVQTVLMNVGGSSEFIHRLRSLRASGKRILVYTASTFSSHILNDTPIQRYERETGEHLVSISAGPLALRSDQEQLIDPPCVGSERDRDGVAPLGCAFLKAGRGYYRKHLAQDHYVAIMNSPLPEDYLLMTSAPGQVGGPPVNSVPSKADSTTGDTAN